MKKEKIGTILIWLAGAVALFAFWISERVPQDIEYHRFSDTISLFSIPNTLNVLSNLPFLIVGMLGFLLLVFKPKKTFNIAFSNIYSFFWVQLWLA